jgi:hypothetical protein
MACYADRGVLFVGADGGAGTGGESVSGAAGHGAPGTAGFGSSGAAGAGASGAAGTTGSVVGCDAAAIFTAHTCSLQGACHDRNGTSAGFDMATPGWEKTLVDRYPKAGGGAGLESMCRTFPTPYLWPDHQPAEGLFLMKLTMATPWCGAHMPSVGAPLTQSELDCVQLWANQLVADAH